MPVPGIIAGVVARTVAAKAAGRAVGGIVGKGGKNVNPLYNTPVKPNVTVKPAGPRGAYETEKALRKVNYRAK